MMRKSVSLLLVLALVFTNFALIPKASAIEEVIFQDDFEDYSIGGFPSAGGWQVVYNGAGDASQMITDSYSHSPTKCLHLLGQNAWSSVIHNTFLSSLNAIGYEGYLMPTSFSYGLENGGPGMSFENAQIVQWGRYYAGISFWNGVIWSTNNGVMVALQNFTQINTWYKIRVMLDKTTRVFDVWINDVLIGDNLVEKNDPNEILALQLSMGWQTFPGYFDDVKVFQSNATLSQDGFIGTLAAIIVGVTVPMVAVALIVQRRRKGKEEMIIQEAKTPLQKTTFSSAKSGDHVFISHVEEDAKLAVDIAKGLEQVGYKTWYHERDSIVGLSYLLATMHAIEKSAAVILIISPHSLSSNQVTKEVIRTHEAGKPFIPLLNGISHAEFQQRQPEWREAIGAATSLSIPKRGVSPILPRIIEGLASLGVKKKDEPASSTA